MTAPLPQTPPATDWAEAVARYHAAPIGSDEAREAMEDMTRIKGDELIEILKGAA